MKNHTLWMLLLCLTAGITSLSAQVVNGRLGTSMYTFEKFDTVGTSNVYVRAMQTLQLDVTQENVSLYTSLTGGLNFREKITEEGTVRVNSLYLRWRDLANVADLSLGRMPVFSGVGNGLVDGAMLKARTWENRLAIQAFAGENVPADLLTTQWESVNKNLFLGGQVIGTFTPALRVGVSYMKRNIERPNYFIVRADSLFNPMRSEVTPDSRAEQIVGADLLYDFLDAGHTLSARYEYDLYTKKNLRGEVRARVQTTDRLSLSGAYILREPRIYYNSIFSVFPTTRVNEYEAGADYALGASRFLFARFAYLEYTDAVSRRLNAGINCRYASLSYTGINGYAGALSSFDAQFQYPLMEKKLVPTVGASYGTYRTDENLSGKEEVLAGSLGAVLRFVKDIALDLQVQWLQTPFVENDVRFFGRFNYWFHNNLNLFSGKEAQ